MKTFLIRCVSAVVYVALLAGCLLLNKYVFLAIMLFFLGVMMFEFMRMTMGDSYRVSQILTIFSGLCLFSIIWAVRAFPSVKGGCTFFALIPFFIVMINSLYVKDKADFGKFANVYATMAYIALPFSICNFLVMDMNGNFCGLLLLLFFVLIWVADAGAYIFGITLGQKFGKKLFPSISPKKSWIGFWGGFVCTLAVSYALFALGMWQMAGLDRFTWYHALCLGAVMNIMGVYGDLFESQWKRHYDVKDSGNIIPGHGGLLDRLDSTLFAVPAGFIYLALFHLFVITL